jgi:phage gpG-like protein
MANSFNFDKIAQRIKSIDLSLDMANTAKMDFIQNFRNQSFNGKKWAEVERRKPETEWYKRGTQSDRNRAILQGKGSGRLRGDVENSVKTGHKNGNLSYTLIVNNPYAAVHNEGLNAKIYGKKSFKMPQRQFIGMTPELNKKLLLKISQRLNKAWGI